MLSRIKPATLDSPTAEYGNSSPDLRRPNWPRICPRACRRCEPQGNRKTDERREREKERHILLHPSVPPSLCPSVSPFCSSRKVVITSATICGEPYFTV